ncbi:amidase signature domain-containing protein [Hyaloraphidium curvatum]|nr:amidase signature domain-containing protein [Hyaloraphidium curvatum]
MAPEKHLHAGRHLMDYSATEIAALVNSRAVSPVAVVLASFERIDRLNGILNAFVALGRESALKAAEELDRKLKEDPNLRMPLAGVPLGVKDLEDAAGLPTSFGCALFVDNIAERDSVQVARLKVAGCIVVGKTNTPIFGSSGFTQNLPFGTTRNPWNLQLTPGGSSGGSSAAVAAKMVPLATGADGGGSIRIPAANTGLVGFKGTVGRIPQQENALFRTSPWILCVHFGPMTRTWDDAAAYMDAASGYHPLDMQSLPRPPSPYLTVPAPPRLRIVYTPSLTPVLDPRIAAHVSNSLAVFRRLGHTVEERTFEIPSILAPWGLLMGSQLAATVRPYIVDKFGDEALAKIEKGVVRSWDAVKSIVDLERMGDLMRDVFELNAFVAENVFPGEGESGGYDLFVTPGLPIPPVPANGKMPKEVNGESVDASDLYGTMAIWNFLGNPAAVVRCAAPGGISEFREVMSSLQIVGAKHRDDLVLAAVKEYIGAVPGLLADWPTPEDIEAQAAKLGIIGGQGSKI